VEQPAWYRWTRKLSGLLQLTDNSVVPMHNRGRPSTERESPPRLIGVRRHARAMFSAVLELVFPRSCLGCDTPGPGLCRACAATAVHAVPGIPVPAFAAGAYDGPLRAALLRYKERGRRDLGAPLAGCLAAAVARIEAPDAVLVPVPSSAASLRARGYDHLGPLTRRVARAQRHRVVDGLTLRRGVADSAGLGAAQRQVNLSGAMSARRPPSKGATAIVVDDIVTTGASAREACRALEATGWQVAGFAAIAATPLPSHPVRSRYPARTSGTSGVMRSSVGTT
jgi:predicted amidophosphoribosyltransferase